MRTFLHVGCGTKHKGQTTRGFNTDAWIELRLDIDESVDPDIVGSMTEMSAVASESVDAVFSSHNIEHLYPHEVLLALREFLRVLKPDGFLVVTCPDLQSVCRLVAEDKLTEPAYTAPAGPIAPLDILYGHLGLQDCLYHGNLDAKRDWGHARDYVEAMWLMLQQPEPEDYVIASGEQYSVRDFVGAVAKELGMELEWRGAGLEEKAYWRGRAIIAIDPRYFRPTEVETLLGDASKARQKLGWQPRVGFAELVREMVAADLKEAERERLLQQHGHRMQG